MRLFTAIILPAVIRRQLVHFQQTLKSIVKDDGHTVETDNLHITLNFFGEKTEDESRAIIEKLEVLHLETQSYIKLATVTCVRKRYGGIIWINVIPPNALIKLATAIANAVDFPQTRAFMPHVTVLRMHKMRARVQKEIQALDFASTSFEFSGFSLMVSKKSDNGVRYTELKKF